MNTATISLWLIAIGLSALAWQRKDKSLQAGIRLGWQTLRRTFLLLVFAFIIVGYVNVLSPQQLVQQYIGPESGWQGLILAEGVGMLLPGGPYVVFPLIAAIYQAGAGIAPAVTLITSWASLGLLSVTFELPFMGWRFTAVRMGVSIMIPLFAGLVVLLIFG